MDKGDRAQITKVRDKSVAKRLDAKAQAQARTAERLNKATPGMIRRPGMR